MRLAVDSYFFHLELHLLIVYIIILVERVASSCALVFSAYLNSDR